MGIIPRCDNSATVAVAARSRRRAESADLQLLLGLLADKNFLSFAEIEAETGLSYSEIIALKQALITALGVDVTSRIDLGGFFVEH